MTYLDKLVALRDSLLDSMMAGTPPPTYRSYGLDGEQWEAVDVMDQLEKINALIIQEQNRVTGRVDLKVIRGRPLTWW